MSKFIGRPISFRYFALRNAHEVQAGSRALQTVRGEQPSGPRWIIGCRTDSRRTGRRDRSAPSARAGVHLAFDTPVIGSRQRRAKSTENEIVRWFEGRELGLTSARNALCLSVGVESGARVAKELRNNNQVVTAQMLTRPAAVPCVLGSQRCRVLSVTAFDKQQTSADRDTCSRNERLLLMGINQDACRKRNSLWITTFKGEYKKLW